MIKEKKVFYPRYIYWELSNYCNLRCRHCFAEADNGADTIVDKGNLFRVIDEMIITTEKTSIRFGGGEPLLVPYLYDLIKFCTNKNVNTAITTNGILLSDNIIEKLYLAGLKEITVSIDGLKENHDFLRGLGNFERTKELVGQIIKLKLININLAFTVTSINYYEIRSFVERFISIGITKFYFFRYCPNSSMELLSLNSKQLYLATEALVELSSKYKKIKFIYEGLSFYPFLFNFKDQKLNEGCNFLKNIITIKYNGDVVVCAAIPKVLGNIFMEVPDKIFSKISKEKKAIKRIPKDCSMCIFTDACHGGCKCSSYYDYNDYLHKDKSCFIEILS